MNLTNISPINTEKALNLIEKNSCYVFMVDKRATKLSVKVVLEKLLKQEIVKVNMVNCKGKQKRFKGKIGQRSSFKKAYVYFKPGTTIDLVS